MKSRPSPLPRLLTALPGILALNSSLCAPSLAADPPSPSSTPADSPLNTLLRDALFEEEATRDLTKAATGYETLLTKWSEQRPLAAAALYRLAEVRRKQDRKDDAITLYQRLLREFSDVEPHARLSRENLAALGTAPESAPAPALAVPSAVPSTPASAEEANSLAFYQKLAAESPDLLSKQDFTTACSKGQLSLVKFFLTKNITDNGEGLTAASSAGHLAIVRELLTLKPLPAYLTSALTAAANSGRTAIIKLLLDSGAIPDSPDDTHPALTAAIKQGSAELIDLLLAHKATVNPPKALTTPLYVAAARGDETLVQRLLDLGANPAAGGSDPDPSYIPPPPTAQPSPPGSRPSRRVVVPTQASQNPPAMAQQIPRPGVPSQNQNPNEYTAGPGATPLHAAVAAGSIECVAALLKAKADPNAADKDGWTPLHAAASAGDADLIFQLTAAGAKPDPETAPPQVKGHKTPLIFAVLSGNVHAIQALLKAGASTTREVDDANAFTYLMYEQKDPKLVDEITAAFLDAGADPTAGKNSALSVAPARIRIPLLRKYTYPKLAAKPDITFVFGDGGNQSTLATRHTADETPPSFPDLLLAWNARGGWGNLEYGPPDWDSLRIWRKKEGAETLTETIVPLKSGTEFPALQWGDILEIITEDAGASNSRIQPNSGGFYGGNAPSSLIAVLRGTQNARITFKCDGLTEDLTLRGVLRTYNVETHEAPLLSMDELIPLLAGTRPGIVRIERSAARGGGAVEWSTADGPGKAGSIPPVDGDVITFTPAKQEPDTAPVTLRIQGHPGAWTGTNGSQSITLLQFLADFYCGLPAFAPGASILKDTPRDQRVATLKSFTPDEIVAKAIKAGQPPSSRPYIPWPDLSAIKINRFKIYSTPKNVLNEKGETVQNYVSEARREVETINLATAIAALKPESPAEEAQKYDVILNPGDEVELPLLKEHPQAPWTGFDEATLRLFQKALAFRLTIVEPDGRFREASIQWLPPRWVPTTAGVLPIPDGDATAGRVHWLLADYIADSLSPGNTVTAVLRGGKPVADESGSTPAPGEFFCRQDDTLQLQIRNSQRGVPIPNPPARAIPAPSRPGRQRVVLPTQNQ